MTTNSENKPAETPRVTPPTTANSPTPSFAPQTLAPAKMPDPVKAEPVKAAPTIAAPEKAAAAVKSPVENVKAAPKARSVKAKTARAVKKAEKLVAVPSKSAAQKFSPLKATPAKAKGTARKAKKPAAAKAASRAANPDFTDLRFMEMPEFFKAQMEMLNKSLFPHGFELGDMNVAKQEFSELLEAQRGAALSSLSKVNQEMEKFFETSVSKTISAGSELMHAKTLPELIETQAKLTQNSIEAYIAHSRQLGAIANAAALDAFRPLNMGWGEKMTGFFKQAS